MSYAYNDREEKKMDKYEKLKSALGVTGIIVAVVALFVIVLSATIVPAGRVGIITRFGAVERTVTSGLSWKIPLIERCRRMDIRTQKNQIDVGAASYNLQEVTATIAVNYHLDPAYALSTFETIGVDYEDIVIDPAIQNVFKGATAQYTAEALITQREVIRVTAEERLKAELIFYHVIVENFNIVNFDFSDVYNEAIEAKQVAQQEVETAKQLLEKAKVEAETAVTEAQGQADSQKALRDSGGLTTEYLQYLFLTIWDGSLPSVMGGASPVFDVGNFIPSSP